uniref:Structural polyprotein n=1 Tax=Bastrovirus 6 TaxID=1803389 RepID=A0A125RWQ7_9VIRU|nr:structural polyprotein [Bastrovirus 6]
MAPKKAPAKKPTQPARRRQNPVRKSQPKPSTHTQKTVRSLAKRVQRAERAATGPVAAVRHTVTATLGTIGPNTSSGTELEFALPLHPGLVKETAAVNSFGPLQSAVGQYSMWRLVNFHVHLTPMVGSSAISGTVYRVSLNLSGQPTSTAWSGLGARQHRDATPGSHLRWAVADSTLAGPKATWWYSNTNAPGVSALGPVLELHSIGSTQSAYQAKPFEGPVFLLEIRGTWEFVNYAAAPALSLLSSGKGTGTLGGQAGQPLTVKVNEPHLQKMVTLQAGSAPSGVGEVIYMLVDTAVTAIADTAAPPWSWMIRAGWWFARALVGGSNGEGTLQLYSSFEDASNNRPCILSGDARGDLGSLQITQLTTPSSGLNALNDGIVGMPSPGQQPIQPGASFSMPVSLSPLPQHVSVPGGYWVSTAGGVTSGNPAGFIRSPLGGANVAHFEAAFMVTGAQGPGFGFEGVAQLIEVMGVQYPMLILATGQIHCVQGTSNTYVLWWLVRSLGTANLDSSNGYAISQPSFTLTTQEMVQCNWTVAHLTMPPTQEGMWLLMSFRGIPPTTLQVKGHQIPYHTGTEVQYVPSAYDWFRWGPTTMILNGTALGDGVYGSQLHQRLAMLTLTEPLTQRVELIHNTATGPDPSPCQEDVFEPALGDPAHADDAGNHPGSP